MNAKHSKGATLIVLIPIKQTFIIPLRLIINAAIVKKIECINK